MWGGEEFLGGHTVHGERRGHKLSTTEYREKTNIDCQLTAN